MTEIATYEHHFVTRDKAPGDRDVGCGPEPGEPHPSGLAEQSVEHLWASADDGRCERFSLAGSEDADAFPVTRLWL